MIQAIDMGDSMFVHAFGAYFGLAVSLVLSREDVATEKEGSNKTSDTFAMIGEGQREYGMRGYTFAMIGERQVEYRMVGYTFGMIGEGRGTFLDTPSP